MDCIPAVIASLRQCELTFPCPWTDWWLSIRDACESMRDTVFGLLVGEHDALDDASAVPEIDFWLIH